MSRNSKKDDYLRKREEGFNLNSLDSVKMREYDALRDPNMRHYFENKPIQYFLYRTGQIDQHGRVIDLQKNKSKLFILEREFHEAEKIEEKRQKEEMEMRYRVQSKRFNEIEKARKNEIIQRLKAERDLSKEIVSTLRLAQTSSTVSLGRSGKKSKSSTMSDREGFFVTEKDH